MATLVERLRQYWTRIDQFGEVEGHDPNLLDEAADALEACEKVLSALDDDFCLAGQCSLEENAAAISAALVKLRGEP